MVRGAALLAILGGLLALGLTAPLLRPSAPFAEWLDSLGVPAAGARAAAIAVPFGIALFAAWRSLRTAERFRITERGLEVTAPGGAYVLEWENIAEARALAGESLGVRVRSREAVLATHSGTKAHREWLRTLPPFGEWDFLYPRADLGYPAAQVLDWLEARRPKADGSAPS